MEIKQRLEDQTRLQNFRKVGKESAAVHTIGSSNDHLEENMNWIESLQKAIAYMEDHLLEDISGQNIAEYCGYCAGHLARGFQIVTGYTFAEYIRNRRLYLAARDLQNSDLKVIDAACRYGYDSPDAFARAFRKFHGFTPNQASEPGRVLQTFLPLQIYISVRGGNKMEYTIQNIPAFDVIGKCTAIKEDENNFEVIPQIWGNFMAKMGAILSGQDQDSAESRAIWQNNIGEFGICYETENGMDYLIAGKYRGGEVPEGYEVRQIPALTWAQFTCLGPVPQALEDTVTQIFTQWLPENPDYQLEQDLSIEFYPMGDGKAADYRSQVWVPIRKKDKAE